MPQDKPDLGEKAISKVAEAGITSQLDEVEELKVDVRTNPGKLVQGEVDSVAIAGKGMVMKQDLRVEELTVKTEKVAINPLNAVFGNIELKQPANADAEIVLTEPDINRALNSDYLGNKLKGLQIEVDGQPITLDVQEAKVHLPNDKELALDVDFQVRGSGEVKQISAVVIPKLEKGNQRITFDVVSAGGQGLSSQFITVLFEELTTLLDLRNFDIPGISLQVSRLAVQLGKFIIYAKTSISQIPSA